MASPMMRNLLELNHFILECRASDAKQMERDKKEIGELADLLRGGVKQSDAQMQLIRELTQELRDLTEQSDGQMQLIKDMEKTMDKLMERKNKLSLSVILAAKLKEADRKKLKQAEEKVEVASNYIELLEKRNLKLKEEIRSHRYLAKIDHMKIQWWLDKYHAKEEQMPPSPPSPPSTPGGVFKGYFGTGV